jgi:hypothetical protein
MNRNVLYIVIAVLGVALWYVYNEKTGNDGFSNIFKEKTPANEGWLNDPGWNNQIPESRPPANPSPTPPVDENPPSPPEIRPPDRNRDNPFRPG